ncbi:DUF11 domain-containing protein [Patescibacteria group bacterium]|nr:DUF11 domain-containing protein [Patescibacteria group bacterium]
MRDNLEKLRERLYKKGDAFSDRKNKIHWLGKKKSDGPASEDWDYSYEDIQKIEQKPKKIFLNMKKIIIISFIIFLLASSAAVFYWIKGYSSVSSSKISIEIESPQRVQAGQPSKLDFFIENNNETALESVNMIVDFPQGVFSSDGQELVRERYTIDRIESNKTIETSKSFIFWGEENQEKNIKIELEYRLEDSNAIFVKEKEYSLIINDPALGISINLPKEAVANQETKIEVNIVSNTDSVIKDLNLEISYPPGFQFLGASPQPSKNDNIWILGDLVSHQQRKIILTGSINGQDSEEKGFRIQAGIKDRDGNLITLGSLGDSLFVKRPFLDLDMVFNSSDESEPVIFGGDFVKGEILWKNNLKDNISDVVIEIRLSGKSLNEKNINADKGSYRSFDKVLVWNSNNISQLKLIKPGESGRASFNFSILSPLPIQSADDKNFSIKIDVSIKGTAMSSDTGSNSISNDISRELKVSSLLQLASKALYYTGDFSNTGPLPPKVGQETTYTVVWSLGNTSNDFSGVKVKAFLPNYARWTGSILPDNENISYNNETGEIVWNMGSLPAGAGILRPAKQVSFQIALLPSMNQVGTSPVLVEKIIYEARDNFTGKNVEGEKSNLNIILNSDSGFDFYKGKVIE